MCTVCQGTGKVPNPTLQWLRRNVKDSEVIL